MSKSNKNYLPSQEQLAHAASAVDDFFDVVLDEPGKVGFGLFAFDSNGHGRMVSNIKRPALLVAVENWLTFAKNLPTNEEDDPKDEDDSKPHVVH